MFAKFICRNDFVHCLPLYMALWLRGLGVSLVNRRSLVQIRAGLNIEMMQIRFLIMFT